MKKNKFLITFLFSASILGGFISTISTVAASQTNGVVSTSKITYLYTKEGKMVTNRALAANTPWITDQIENLPNIGEAYRVATNEWVKSTDIKYQTTNEYNSSKNGTDNNSNKDIIPNTGVATISYTQWGLDLWEGYGTNKYKTGTVLPNNSSWKFIAKAIDSQGNAWYEIGKNQWIDGTYTKITNNSFTDTSASHWDPNFTAVKLNKSTEIYNSNNYNSGVRGSIQQGNIVQVASTLRSGGKIWFELSNGGWIPSSITSVISGNRSNIDLNGHSRQQAIESVISVAKKQIGIPYVWNGRTPSGFDCAGLMQYSFKQALGQNIGAWTVPQEVSGKRVSVSQLQRGDLVFWGPQGATYHVGLYLGNGQYINAYAPGTNVRIDTISSNFYPSFGVRVIQ